MVARLLSPWNFSQLMNSSLGLSDDCWPEFKLAARLSESSPFTGYVHVSSPRPILNLEFCNSAFSTTFHSNMEVKAQLNIVYGQTDFAVNLGTNWSLNKPFLKVLWPLWLLRKNDRKWLADLCRVLIWDCRGILVKEQNDEIPHSLLGWVAPLNPTPGRTPLRGFSPERMNFIFYLLSSFALRWISYHFKIVTAMIPVPVGWVARLLPWQLSCCKTIPDSLYHQLWKWRPLSGLCVLQQRWNTLKRRNVRMLTAY